MTGDSPSQILRDYRVGQESRHVSLIGRREVLTGKAKFGIFGDGKEVPQLAMARAFRPGDVRSGYYRDQTFLLAAGMTTMRELFAQLYADPNPENEPASSGRQMNSHFATAFLDEEGGWLPLRDLRSSTADSSPTASQMPRLVGLTLASRLFREIEGLEHLAHLSDDGNEVAFGTIGNASCAEGPFWEALNAVGVLGGPLVMSIWDDEYGISVHNEHQLAKEDLSSLVAGFARTGPGQPGYEVFTVPGWDYARLCRVYERAARLAREEHVPSIVHVIELTQPQGHSTSGSHERYKSEDRLVWEREHDCLTRMREWIVREKLATPDELDALEAEAETAARVARQEAWDAFVGPVHAERDQILDLLARLAEASAHSDELHEIRRSIERQPALLRRHMMAASHAALRTVRDESLDAAEELAAWRRRLDDENRARYSSHLTSETDRGALRIEPVAPVFTDDSPTLNGFEVVNRCFDAALGRIPELVAFGEDLGQLGDVNQGFSGLQEKYGELRVADTGIRECTIVGQAIGLAMRGFRPIAEIQYLDYLLYGLQTVSDDLATLRWRTRGRQAAPVVLRTRGHRLEGVWHSGSPMGGILGLCRGLWVCVPRDMTRAAGFYNTLLASDDSALVIEVLNGYRTKERLPDNIGDMRLPLGHPEILREGDDLTVVTYGACCRLVLDAAELLARAGLEVEVVDVQTLLPFDRPGTIAASLRKTNRLLVVDEDVPGGASAFIVQQILEQHEAFFWLDSPPRTLTAREHRPAYGSDGDYWSKPNIEEIFDAAWRLLHETEPRRYPLFG